MSMNMSRRAHVVIIGAATLVCAAALTAAAADTLTLQGSTTFNGRLMVPHQTAIEKESGHQLIVVPNKSNLGILALFEKRADLAMLSASLESEIASLKRSKPDLPFERLQAFEVSRTRVAFAVHPSNPVRSTDSETMRRVLSGEITNWRELGGANLPIRVVIPRQGGGVTVTIEAELLGGKQISAPNPIPVQIGTQTLKVVEQEPAALGLAQLGLLQRHNLPELVTDRAISQQLSLVTLGDPSPAMQAVIKASRAVASAKLD
jgi:phosphate transport system substrate-binding protein